MFPNSRFDRILAVVATLTFGSLVLAILLAIFGPHPVTPDVQRIQDALLQTFLLGGGALIWALSGAPPPREPRE